MGIERYAGRMLARWLGVVCLCAVLLCGGVAAVPSGAPSSDVNLIVRVSDCMSGEYIEGALVEVPTAAVQAGSKSANTTNKRGVARIYPLRYGGQEHVISVKAAGYAPHSRREKMKPWASFETNICLEQTFQSDLSADTRVDTRAQEIAPGDLLKKPLLDVAPVYKECQCVAYWSRSEMGRTLSIGVAGLSPDLMITEKYFSQIPAQYGKWVQRTSPRAGDTVIIQSDAFMYLYIFPGNAYSTHTQLRPGHIGIVESTEYLDGVAIDLVGKHYERFFGWRVRFRNTNWPAGWMENNRFYTERIGDAENEIVCKNVGVSEIIVADGEKGITYWGRD